MSVAILLLHIDYVFKLRALYEMGWVATLRNIAGMKNALISFQWSVEELVHQSVSALNFPVDVNFSIPKVVS